MPQELIIPVEGEPAAMQGDTQPGGHYDPIPQLCEGEILSFSRRIKELKIVEPDKGIQSLPLGCLPITLQSTLINLEAVTNAKRQVAPGQKHGIRSTLNNLLRMPDAFRKLETEEKGIQGKPSWGLS